MKNIKLLIWAGFAMITFGMLAWPVAKWMKKDAPQEIFLPEDTTNAFNNDARKNTPRRRAGTAGGLRPIDTALTRDLREGGGRARTASPRPLAPVFARRSSSSPRSAKPRRSSTDDSSGTTTHYGGKKRERAFLRKHYREIRRYQNRLGALGRKYRAKYPALRKMDAEFSKMDRYMALNRQYKKDRNAFNWARGVMALPEVRAALIRYSSDPQVVKAVVEVSLEAMKTPPPQEIQREIQRFLTADPKTSDHVNEVLVQSLGNDMGTLTSMPAKTLAPLQKLGSKVMGTNFANTVDSVRPEALQQYQQQQ